MYQVVDNIDIPQQERRGRRRGQFAETLDNLEVGQGFEYQSKSPLRLQYPRVAPRKFEGKKFKLWVVTEGDGVVPYTFGVARIS